jgi:hypothetical protein
VSFISGRAFKTRHLNMFDCYAGDPSGTNNLVTSVLLNPSSQVVSAVANSTSGSMSHWTSYYYYNALGLGHTAATAFLVWTRENHFPGGELKFSKTPGGNELIQDLGMDWYGGLQKVGDPLFRVGQYSAVPAF